MPGPTGGTAHATYTSFNAAELVGSGQVTIVGGTAAASFAGLHGTVGFSLPAPPPVAAPAPLLGGPGSTFVAGDCRYVFRQSNEKEAVFAFPGAAVVGSLKLRMPFPIPVVIDGVTLGCGIAPQGSPLTVDALVNGTASLWAPAGFWQLGLAGSSELGVTTVLAPGSTPSIQANPPFTGLWVLGLAGASELGVTTLLPPGNFMQTFTSGEQAPTRPTTIPAGGYLGFAVTAVGNLVAGSNLAITVRWHPA